MGLSAYYLSEAQRCREFAAKAPLSERARRWIQLATEYENLAQASNVSPYRSASRNGSYP